METIIQNRKKLIRQAAAGDPRYQKCNREFLKAEQNFFGDDPGIDGIAAGFIVAICKFIK